MEGCVHKDCGTGEKVWMPYFFKGRVRGLKPHPYCSECGLVKNLSSERPRQIGYFINLISELGKQYKIAKVQVRLMVLEMQKQGLQDSYGMDRQQQEKLFLEIAKRCLNVPERAVAELLDR
ncbi:MAG: hypothetical protein ABR985_04250 [Methanotrichaceae archaeon]|jgi:hypothetical protein